MSHITRVETRIRDRRTLLETLDELGCGYELGRTISHAGRSVRVDVAIKQKGAFRFGLRQGSEGEAYEMYAFGLGRSEEKTFRERLQRRYARKKLLKEALRRNYVLVDEKIYGDGKIRLVLRRSA